MLEHPSKQFREQEVTSILTFFFIIHHFTSVVISKIVNNLMVLQFFTPAISVGNLTTT